MTALRLSNPPRGATSADAPWITTYSDLMSLLVVLFVYAYGVSRAVEHPAPASAESPAARVREGSGWLYLGRISGGEAPGGLAGLEAREACEGIEARLVGGRSRIAIVGFAPTRDESYDAATAVRDHFAQSSIEEERMILVSAGGMPGSGPARRVEVYATSGVVGPAGGE